MLESFQEGGLAVNRTIFCSGIILGQGGASAVAPFVACPVETVPGRRIAAVSRSLTPGEELAAVALQYRSIKKS